MSVVETVNRNYSMGDLEMLERAQVFHDSYVIDEALFTAAFTKFGLTYAADFQTAIDAALEVPTAADEDAQIAIVTEQIEPKMEEARKALQKLFNYSDNIFESARTTESFGKNRYQQARNVQLKMISLLETAHDTATETAMQAALVAGGCPLALIASLDTIKDEIWTLNREQESMMNSRYSKTQARIISYNAVWFFMDEINGASKVVFADDPAKLFEYQLYHTTHTAPAQVTGLAYSMSGGLLTWGGVAGTSINYEAAFAPDMPEPIFIQIYDGPDRQVVYNPGGPDNYLFKVRAKAPGPTFGPWSDVLIVVR